MAGLWIPRGFQKPVTGARRNIGHSLSAVTGFLALAPDRVDLVGGTTATGASNGAGYESEYTFGSPNGLLWNAAPSADPSGNWQGLAILAIVAPTVTFASGRVLAFGDTGSSPFVMYTLQLNGGDWRAEFNDGGTTRNIFGSTPTVGQPYTVVVNIPRAAGTARLWVDGARVASTTTTAGAMTATNQQMALGYSPVFGEYAGCRVSLAAVFMRELTDDEIHAVTAEPYAMLTR